MPKILISDAMDNIASEILLKNNLDVETKTDLSPEELKNDKDSSLLVEAQAFNFDS